MFKVIRDCCTNGNCGTCCQKTPYGQKIRVVQIETTKKELAERCFKNFVAYNPEFVEVK